MLTTAIMQWIKLYNVNTANHFSMRLVANVQFYISSLVGRRMTIEEQNFVNMFLAYYCRSLGCISVFNRTGSFSASMDFFDAIHPIKDASYARKKKGFKENLKEVMWHQKKITESRASD
jgi:hypothetical protein